MFITCLTNISDKLSHMKISKEEKLEILKEDITNLNNHFPSNVYIPFVNGKKLIVIYFRFNEKLCYIEYSCF